MKTLITGGAGFIGSHIAQFLLQRADDAGPIVLVDDFSRHGPSARLRRLLESDRITFIEGSLVDQRTFEKLPIDVDRVFHMAAIVGVSRVCRSPFETLAVNARTTLNTFEWFARTAARDARLLFASSSEVYAGRSHMVADFPIPTPETVPIAIQYPLVPRDSYALSKLFGEALAAYAAHASSAAMLCVRYHNVYGPDMGDAHVIPNVVQRIRQRQAPFEVIDAHHTRSFCWIEDAVRLTCALMDAAHAASGTIVNVGDPNGEITIMALCEMLFAICGYRPKEIIARDSGCDPVARRCPDVSLLESLVGPSGCSPLRDGLARTAEFYLNTDDRRALS